MIGLGYVHYFTRIVWIETITIRIIWLVLKKIQLDREISHQLERRISVSDDANSKVGWIVRSHID